jgi:hypothetical protein
MINDTSDDLFDWGSLANKSSPIIPINPSISKCNYFVNSDNQVRPNRSFLVRVLSASSGSVFKDIASGISWLNSVFFVRYANKLFSSISVNK